MRIGVNSGSIDALERGPAMRKVSVQAARRRHLRQVRSRRGAAQRARGAGRAHGGEGARILRLGRRPRLLQLQGLAEKLERADRRRGLSPLRRRLRRAAAPGHHRGGHAGHRRGQVVHRLRAAAGGRHRRHDPCLADRRAGGRDSRRLRDPALAGAALARRHLRLVPLMRARRDRRAQDRQRGGEAADQGADADPGRGDGLRRQRPRRVEGRRCRPLRWSRQGRDLPQGRLCRARCPKTSSSKRC